MTPTFWSLTKQQRRKHLDRSLLAGDIARPARQDGIWLVSSATLSTQYGRPVYYRVNIAQATCPCKGWATLGCCRHTARAIYEAWQASQSAPQLAA